MNIYYNDRKIGKSDKDIHVAMKVMRDFLKSKNIETDNYWRWVELDNGRTMIDYGSWSNFFYIDCPYSKLIENDKTRNLPTDKE